MGWILLQNTSPNPSFSQHTCHNTLFPPFLISRFDWQYKPHWSHIFSYIWSSKLTTTSLSMLATTHRASQPPAAYQCSGQVMKNNSSCSLVFEIQRMWVSPLLFTHSWWSVCSNCCPYPSYQGTTATTWLISTLRACLQTCCCMPAPECGNVFPQVFCYFQHFL